MLKGILIYLMLFVCLLTKDGVSYVFDVLNENVGISINNDVSWEDSMEEESTEDWLNNVSSSNIVPHAAIEKSIKTTFSERNESELNVLLEQVSPPPRMA